MKKNCQIPRKAKTFTIAEDILYYLENNIVEQSAFVERAIRFYIIWLKEPVKIMEECKKRYTHLYKWVGRKNYHERPKW